MLGFLTDEQISHAVAEQVRAKRPDIRIESVLKWQDGVLRNIEDSLLLEVALREYLVLVTYDQRTIPPILTELGFAGKQHAGVIFVDQRSIPSSDIGGLIQALIEIYDNQGKASWIDRVQFLSREPPKA